jgi:crotonobetainyl-CoA:carnitine CoA-transferase CaiB-like acyl-CoA transferase
LAWLTGFPDDGPLVPRGVCDVLGGLHTIIALLAALEHRRTTGEGLLVETALVEAALNIAAEQPIEWTANGILLGRHGNRSFEAAPQGVYRCADDDVYVVLSIATDAQWRSLQAALGEPVWALDERLATSAGRQAAHDEIDAALTDWLRAWTATDAVELFASFGVPAAPTVDTRRLNDLPQLRARGWLQRLQHPVAGELEYQSLPMTFSALPRPVYRRAAPTLGQDNDEVLTELGLSADEIAALAADRIIGTRPAWL